MNPAQTLMMCKWNADLSAFSAEDKESAFNLVKECIKNELLSVNMERNCPARTIIINECRVQSRREKREFYSEKQRKMLLNMVDNAKSLARSVENGDIAHLASRVRNYGGSIHGNAIFLEMLKKDLK